MDFMAKIKINGRAKAWMSNLEKERLEKLKGKQITLDDCTKTK